MEADYLVLPCPHCQSTGQVNAANVNQAYPDALADYQEDQEAGAPEDPEDPEAPPEPEPPAPAACPNCRGVGAYLSTTRESDVLPSVFSEFIDFDALEAGLLASGAVLEEIG